MSLNFYQQLPGLLKDLIEWIFNKYSQRHHFRGKFLLKWKWLFHKIGGNDSVDTTNSHSSSFIATSNPNYDSQVQLFRVCYMLEYLKKTTN